MERTADTPAAYRAWPTTLQVGKVVVRFPVRSTGFMPNRFCVGSGSGARVLADPVAARVAVRSPLGG